MYRLNHKERRVGGLLLEALVLVFVFSSAWPQREFDQGDRGRLIVKASTVEHMVFRDSDSYVKSLLDYLDTAQILSGNFSESFVDVAGLEVKNTRCLDIALSLYNSFYIHLTAKAP